MRIQNNITAMNAQRNLSNNNSALSSNLEKLSSGYRINRAADDAAGLAISEKMRAQITGLETAETNANDGISMVQTAEGALTEVHSMLNRMVELSMKASNGTYSESEREKLQAEVDQLLEEIDRIAESTTFNNIPLLSTETPDTGGTEIASTTVDVGSSFDGITGSLTLEASDLPEGTQIYISTTAAADREYDTTDADYNIDDVIADSISVSTDADGNVVVNIQGAVDENGDTIEFEVTGQMIQDALEAYMPGSEISVTGTLEIATTFDEIPGYTQDVGTGTPTTAQTTIGGQKIDITSDFLAEDVVFTTVDADSASDKAEGLNLTGISGDVTNITVKEIAAETGDSTGDGYFELAEDGTLTIYVKTNPGEFIEADALTNILQVGVDADGNKVLDTNGNEFDWSSADMEFLTDNTDDTSGIGSGEYIFQASSVPLADGEEKTLIDFNITIADDADIDDTWNSGDGNIYIESSNTYGSQDTSVNGNTSNDNKGIIAAGDLAATDFNVGNIVTTVDTITPTISFATGAYDEEAGKTIEVEVDGAGAITVTLTGAEGDTFTDAEIEDAVRAASGYGLDLSGFTFDSGDGIEFLTDSDGSSVVTGATLDQNVPEETTYREEVAAEPLENLFLGGTSATAPVETIVIQVGNSSATYNQVVIEKVNMTVNDLGLTGLDISSSQEAAVAALDQINIAIDLVSDARSQFGAIQNRLDHTINNLGVAVENMQSAESRVRDVDMAAEMMEYTKNNILVQSAQAMLAQANQVPQGVLQLLQ